MTAFFMLSGYALFYVYQSRDLTQFDKIKLFYKKRAISILPVYYSAALIFILLFDQGNLLKNLFLAPIEILGIQTVFSSLFGVAHNGGTWFISCILFCYLLFPYFSECIKKLQFKCKLILLLIFVCILLYSPLVTHFLSLATIYSNPFFRMLEFLIGVLLASMQSDFLSVSLIKKWLLNPYAVIVESLIMFIAVTIAVNLNIAVRNYMMYSWICLPLFILILPALAELNFPRLENSKLLAYLSALAYSFFIAQLFIWQVRDKLLSLLHLSSLGNLEYIIISFILCLIIAIAFHELIEKPCKKLLSKQRKTK